MDLTDWHGLSFEDIDLRLCTLCGTCISACPVPGGALAWQPFDDAQGSQETIAFDRARCVNCGICYAVCPPENPQGTKRPACGEVGAALPGRNSAADDPLIGPYMRLSRVHAADLEIRKTGSAGGAVTALLLSALEQDLIDGALVVATDPDNPTRSQATVARTPAAIRAAAESKYCLVPVNALLDRIGPNDRRLAVTTLPCQAHGIRLAQTLGLAIARRVSLVIGLFCGFNVKYEGTAYLLRKLGMDPAEVATLEYRGGPWPGGFRAVTHDGRKGFIPKHQYTYVHLMYAPEGCWYCPDLTAEFADLSVGDYWIGDTPGWSMTIGRTAAGQTLLDNAAARGEIVVEPIRYDEVLASHRHLLTYKKKGV
ncbi:MAG: Coenzyme F420 hydrogenase/dehydrogenase, beta subunit C-terminal domain, partial [Anaerolineae bacterium]